MLDKINAGMDWLNNKAVQGTDYVGSKYKQANDAARDFHRANTQREPVPPSAGRYNSDKYSVDQLCYPDDLMSEVYGGNYAIFYINVSADTRLGIAEESVELDPQTEPRLRGKLVAKNMSVGQLISATTASNALANVGAGKKATENIASGTIGLSVAGTMAPDASRSQRRLKSAIGLHIPNQLSVRYGMQWSEEDTAGVQAMADGIQAALSRKGAKAKMVQAGTIAQEAVAGMAIAKAPAAASAALGIAANPKKEQTFKGVDFRKFTFDYQFFPRDETEAANVIRIIEKFKLHMHPEFKSELNYVYLYPSEFDITYYTNGVENPNIHRHTSCVLEEMTVNYTPNGSFSTFPNGMPTQINMSLSFKELQLLSKETVLGGL